MEWLTRMLPALRENAQHAKFEVGMAVLPGKEQKPPVFVNGTGDSVTFPTLQAVLLAHTHPDYMYPGTVYHPPTGNDIAQFLRATAEQIASRKPNMGSVPFPEAIPPLVFVVTSKGMWQIKGLTPTAKLELNKVVEAIMLFTPEKRIEEDDFLQVAEQNADDYGWWLNRGEITVRQYLEAMRTLWGKDMGVNIVYTSF